MQDVSVMKEITDDTSSDNRLTATRDNTLSEPGIRNDRSASESFVQDISELAVSEAKRISALIYIGIAAFFLLITAAAVIIAVLYKKK